MKKAGQWPLFSIFGPTGVGKTGVAIELGELISASGGSAVAVNCDSIQVYRGLEVLSGAADASQQDHLEHRLLSFVPVSEEFSAGRYASLAHAEIDALRSEGRAVILVGGTGLYLRGALTDMKFRPPVPDSVRSEVEADIQTRGLLAVYEDIPEHLRQRIHPNDRSRVARITELLATGQSPAPDHQGGGELWTAKLRVPSVLIGLVDTERELRERIELRVRQMAAAGAGEEVRRALESGASRTAQAAIGFKEFLSGDLNLAATHHWQYARRQMTWLRKMEGIEVLVRSGRDDRELAELVLELARSASARNAPVSPSG